MSQSTILKYAAFPAVGGALTAVLFAFPGSVGPAYAALVAAVAIGALLERVIPYTRDWNTPQGDLGVDTAHALAAVILGPLTGFLATTAVASLRPWIPGLVDGLSFPLAAQVLGALVVSGFLPYWFHRLAHETDGVFWRAHSVHHSSERLYWLNSLRVHPLNILWNSSGLLLALLAGFSGEAVFIAGALNNFVSIYNHLNVDFRLGGLNWVFNMNELHRWHHSRNQEEANSNYSGGALNVWDTIFGTRFLPNRRLAADNVGLFDARNYPLRSYVRQLLYPVCACGD